MKGTHLSLPVQAPAASARPEIITLDVLLNDVDEGRIQIPRFQRAYVWAPQMMRELFESVLNGYPIGSLLFWNVREFSVATMNVIGPVQAPARAVNLPMSLVLDGHQRLATLWGVLRLPEDYSRDFGSAADRLGWWLAYDLTNEQVRQMRGQADFLNPTILPLRVILRTAEFVRFARNIDRSLTLSEAEKTLYLDRADEVQRKIRDYKISLTVMRDGTVNDAVAIFSRINRSGRRMSADQMAVALTYSEGFNLDETLSEILGALKPFGFDDVSRTVILQSLMEAAGQNFVKPKFDDLRKPSTQEDLAAATTGVTEALCEAVRFFNEVIGYSTGRLLPYALQLLMLAVFFRVSGQSLADLDTTTVEELSRWFWATSFSGWFASANSSEIEKSVRIMTAFASEPKSGTMVSRLRGYFEDRPLRPFPKTFDSRSARIRAMLLVQMNRKPLRDPSTLLPINGSQLMAEAETRELPYIFRPINDVKESRSPANRILLDGAHGRSTRSFLKEAIDKSSDGHTDAIEALEAYGIDQQARLSLQSGDLRAFVQAREDKLMIFEQEFLQHFGLKLSSDIQRSDEEVDQEAE